MSGTYLDDDLDDCGAPGGMLLGCLIGTALWAGIAAGIGLAIWWVLR